LPQTKHGRSLKAFGIACLALLPPPLCGALQIDPQDGKRLLQDISVSRNHLAQQQSAFRNLFAKPYFSSSLEVEFVRDNLTSIRSLLDESAGNLPSLRYEAAFKAWSAAQGFIYQTDVMLQEDQKATPTSFTKSAKDDFVVPRKDLPQSSGLELRALIYNEFSLTQRLVAREGLAEPSGAEMGYTQGAVTYPEGDPRLQCVIAVVDFHKQVGYPRDFEPESIRLLHLLQYEKAQDLIWRAYSSAQNVATACHIR
jgi:hypothetical protein